VTTSVLTTVSTEQEAEMLCGLLRSANIVCDHRTTQSGAKFGGALEVLVRPEDLEDARSLLPKDE
jgi:hypothetical protein